MRPVARIVPLNWVDDGNSNACRILCRRCFAEKLSTLSTDVVWKTVDNVDKEEILMDEKIKEKLLDVYFEVDKDDVAQRKIFWDVLACFGVASDFMKCLQEKKEEGVI